MYICKSYTYMWYISLSSPSNIQLITCYLPTFRPLQFKSTRLILVPKSALQQVLLGHLSGRQHQPIKKTMGSWKPQLTWTKPTFLPSSLMCFFNYGDTWKRNGMHWPTPFTKQLPAKKTQSQKKHVASWPIFGVRFSCNNEPRMK